MNKGKEIYGDKKTTNNSEQQRQKQPRNPAAKLSSTSSTTITAKTNLDLIVSPTVVEKVVPQHHLPHFLPLCVAGPSPERGQINAVTQFQTEGT